MATCVLALHRLVDEVTQDHDTSWPAFRAVLQAVRSSGRRTTTHLEPGALDEPGVVLTLDDGTADHLAAGVELHDRGLSAVFFVPTDRLGTPGYLDDGQLRHLSSLGHVVGSHTRTHLPLDTLTPAQLTAELAESKYVLEQRLGVTVAYFAAPGGITTASLPAMLEEHGYLAARSMRWGFCTTSTSRWDVPVIPVTELTVERGWITEVLLHGRLPAAMKGVRWVRDLVPRSLRPTARRVLARLLPSTPGHAPEA